MADENPNEPRDGGPEAVRDDSDQVMDSVLNEAADGVSGETVSADGIAPTDELAEAKDQVLRAHAEMENLRRRNARDVENAHKYAVERFVADLLPVLDSLDKAVEAAEATDGAQPIAEGVSLSLKLTMDTLAKHGIVRVDPLGEQFDPQHHEAIAMVPNPDAEPNSIMDVMLPGYLLNGRVVRAAKVIVVKAPD